MIVLLLAGCSTNWIGTWDISHFELQADGASLVHEDMGWVSCDDDDLCIQLRRYDIDYSTLEPLPLERVWTEYGHNIDFDPEVVMAWGEGMQLQLEVTRSTQQRIVLQGQGVVTAANSPWQYVDATLELTR